jgi:hypothetical protein
MRGHNLSSKPADVHAYLTCTLVEDIRQFIEVDGATHWLAEERPELVSKAIRDHIARAAAHRQPATAAV